MQYILVLLLTCLVSCKVQQTPPVHINQLSETAFRSWCIDRGLPTDLNRWSYVGYAGKKHRYVTAHYLRDSIYSVTKWDSMYVVKSQVLQ